MDVVNAISKVRFSSARPQRVQMSRSPGLTAELLCFEPGQELKLNGGPACYYIVTGAAKMDSGGEDADLAAGQFAAVEKGEAHTIACAGEQRLVCLAVRASS